MVSQIRLCFFCLPRDGAIDGPPALQDMTGECFQSGSGRKQEGYWL